MTAGHSVSKLKRSQLQRLTESERFPEAVGLRILAAGQEVYELRITAATEFNARLHETPAEALSPMAFLDHDIPEVARTRAISEGRGGTHLGHQESYNLPIQVTDEHATVIPSDHFAILISHDLPRFFTHLEVGMLSGVVSHHFLPEIDGRWNVVQPGSANYKG